MIHIDTGGSYYCSPPARGWSRERTLEFVCGCEGLHRGSNVPAAPSCFADLSVFEIRAARFRGLDISHAATGNRVVIPQAGSQVSIFPKWVEFRVC